MGAAKQSDFVAQLQRVVPFDLKVTVDLQTSTAKIAAGEKATNPPLDPKSGNAHKRSNDRTRDARHDLNNPALENEFQNRSFGK